MWNLLEYKNKTAFIDANDNVLSYEELDQFTHYFNEKIEKRCLIFLLCTNQMGSVMGYVSAINNNIVPVLLNAKLDNEFIYKLIDIYHPAYIWLPKDKQAEFTQYSCVLEVYGYILLKTDFSDHYKIFEGLGLMLTTSGSTGSPKFVRQSYKNISENAKSIVEYLRLDQSERPITTLPMNYTYGLSIINSHLLVGATILLSDYSVMQKEFWQFFKEKKATSFGGVPYTYEMLLRLNFFRMNLPSLRYMTQAGGKLSKELHKKIAEYAIKAEKKFIVMYGQCEATARMSYLPAEHALDKCGSIGLAIPGGSFKLVDEINNIINQPNVMGELIYEGENVTLGYAACIEDLNKKDDLMGRLETGDLAIRDQDGYYYIVGRKKRFIKIYGNRINLDEIEELIKDKFANMECASAGVDDNMYLFITEPALSGQVHDYISKKLGINKVAFQIVIIDSIPKNEAGKTQYAKLEKYYNA